jgi:hypothetical protein
MTLPHPYCYQSAIVSFELVCCVVFPPPTLPTFLPWTSVAADVDSDGVGRRPLADVDARSRRTADTASARSCQAPLIHRAYQASPVAHTCTCAGSWLVRRPAPRTTRSWGMKRRLLGRARVGSSRGRGRGSVRRAGARPDAGDVGASCVEVGVGAGAGAVISAGTYTLPNSVLPSGERDCRHSLTRSVPTPRRSRASVTSQTKPLEESMPVAAAVTYVLRSCREPICAAITPPSVCVRSVFTHLLVGAASWFGDFAVSGF